MDISSNVLLTVVIPAYNASATIRRCLDSIDDADWRGTEVLVIDDGSDDDVQTAIAGSAVASHVRLIRQERSGVSVARNRGLREARGQFVLFMDADDQLAPGSLTSFLSDAVDSNADICIGDFHFQSETGRTPASNLNTSRVDFDARDATTFQWLCLGRVGFDSKKNVGLLGAPWAKIYRRDFLTTAFPDDQVFTPGVNRGQDVLTNVEAFGKAKIVRYHQKPTYIYTISANSSSHRAYSGYIESVQNLGEHLDALLHRENWAHLAPAVAKVRVTLLEEGILRLGEARDRTSIRQIAEAEPFATGLKKARVRDFSTAGKVKLTLLRWRMYGPYSALLTRRRPAA